MKRLHLRTIPFYIQMTVFLPIVMVLFLVIGILVFNRVQKAPPKEENMPPEAVIAPVDVLCILREQETVFYTVVTVDPMIQTVTAKPLTDKETDTVYRSDGAAVLLEALQERGEEVDFYVDITFEQMREWLQYLGNGVGVVLDDKVTYTDAAGLTVSFPAGAITLSANQTADMLRGVAKQPHSSQTAAILWENLVRRYTVKERDFASDYTALTDIGDTNIRIYDFHKALPHLQKMTETK